MSTFVIGDIHGHFNDYTRLLKTSDICDENLEWKAGTDHLWIIGDFFDRGVSGIDCLELTMSLQEQAEQAGGMVNAILGNHELMILCAWYFGDESTSTGTKVIDQWLTWGGVRSDLERLTPAHVEWIGHLPAMCKIGDRLLMHADAMLYVNHGHTVAQVNTSFQNLMKNDDLSQWEMTLNAFSEHRAFCQLGITGTRRAKQILKLFGAKQLVHGHTPISFARGVPPEEVTEAWHYADDLCVNVDPGFYLGGPGFVYKLS